MGRNIAEASARLGVPPKLVSAIGDDADGAGVMRNAEQLGIDTSGVKVVPGAATATYCAIMDDTGDLTTAIADMRVFDNIDPHDDDDHDDTWLAHLDQAPFIIMDGNVPTSTMEWLCGKGQRQGAGSLPIKPIWFEPTSLDKAQRVMGGEMGGDIIRHIALVTPNEAELHAMVQCLPSHPSSSAFSASASSSSSSSSSASFLAVTRLLFAMLGGPGFSQKAFNINQTSLLGEQSESTDYDWTSERVQCR